MATFIRLVDRLWRWTPPPLKTAARWTGRVLPGRRVELGSLERTSPVSACYGFDRGTPVDRPAIEAFLRGRRGDIRGHCGEVRSASYVRRLGGRRVTAVDVIDVDRSNPEATLVVDLCVAGSLPTERFDCLVVTQTLQFLVDVDGALRNLYGSLRPEGVLLVTAPCLSRIDPEARGRDYWRFTPDGLGRALRAALPPEALMEVGGSGNVLLGAAFLFGLAAEELGRDVLDYDDADFPLVAFAAVRKPPRSGSADAEDDGGGHGVDEQVEHGVGQP